MLFRSVSQSRYDAGIDISKFVEYNDFCEQVKREVKIELLTPMNLEDRKNELKAKFASKQIEIKQAIITAEETVGSDNATLQYLKTQLVNERVRIITIIDNFTTIEKAMAFDIRDEIVNYSYNSNPLIN